jgi:hypothetical protein
VELILVEQNRVQREGFCAHDNEPSSSIKGKLLIYAIINFSKRFQLHGIGHIIIIIYIYNFSKLLAIIMLTELLLGLLLYKLYKFLFACSYFLLLSRALFNWPLGC